MPGRQRTAKSLGTRHDLNYFKHRNWLRKWQVWLGLALPLVVVAWLGAQAIHGRMTGYSAGPLSSAHAVFGQQCTTCHVERATFSRFRRHVPDSACLSCHTAPAHHATQAFTPECSACHREHTGTPLLAKVPNQACTQCHTDLHSRSGELKFVAHINGFNSDHPQFAILRQSGLDPGTIAFNHYIHLKDPILGPRNHRVVLECSDCHRPPAEAGRSWPYALAGLTQAAEDSMDQGRHMELDPNAGRVLMAPVSYAQSCAACHTLQFDRRFTESVPHDKPEIVDKFVRAKFAEYLVRNPGAWREREPSLRPATDTAIRNYLNPVAMAQPRSPEEWLNQSVAESERLLWTKTCHQCHEFVASGPQAGALPQVKPANIKKRWFEHAVFSHQSHQTLQCTSCHGAALTSTDTKDVLLPSIATCQSCHNAPMASYGHAENRCFECHQYHNWMEREPGFKGRYSIPQLVGELKPSHAATAAR